MRKLFSTFAFLLFGITARAGAFDGNYYCPNEGESVTIRGSYAYMAGVKYLVGEGPVRSQPQSINLALFALPHSSTDFPTYDLICQKQ